MQETLQQEFVRLAKSLDLKHKDLARLLKLSPGSVSKIFSSKQSPRPHTVELLRRVLQESKAGVFKGDAESGDSNAMVLRDESSDWRMVPVISWASAGVAADYEELMHQIEEYVQVQTRDPRTFALILEGVSMEPEFHAGDRIVCSPQATPRHGCYVAARLKQSGGVLFKRFILCGPEGSKVRLESLNSEFKPTEHSPDDFAWIYPAISRTTKLWI